MNAKTYTTSVVTRALADAIAQASRAESKAALMAVLRDLDATRALQSALNAR